MLTTDEITEIFYLCDDFSKEFDKSYKKTYFGCRERQKDQKQAKQAVKQGSNDDFDHFHLGGFRNLKNYYVFYVKQHLNGEFPLIGNISE